MTDRAAFIQACLDRTQQIVTICDQFGISEKTGHKWLRRFRTHGVSGLAARSHAPRHHPHRMAPEVVDQILALRRRHPDYGAAKLRDRLAQQDPTTRWPAASSIGALLTREGLVRRRRRIAPAHTALDGGPTPARTANHVWTADFKGQFRVGTGAYCYPLTVLDLHSHFLLGCTALPSIAVALTRHCFVRLFREYGLPEVLRTDNGVPFAQPNALGRLGQLAFWWVRLGIRPEHTQPGRPSENGAHERFHKTLKAATTRPPGASVRAQQRRFDGFQREYNQQRPHASLPGHVPPAQVYPAAGSPRPYPSRLPPLHYPTTSEVRRVSEAGAIKWRQQSVFLSSNLAGDYVSLTETEAELITIAYGQLALGNLDPHLNRFVPRVRWEG
jgi:putative transposase